MALALTATLLHAGHDELKVSPALQRSPGKVVALGDRHSFEAKPLRAAAYRPDELRGWRLTMIGGKRFGAAFRVAGNTESRIILAPTEGTLEGVAVGDLFMAEEVGGEKPQ